MLTVNAHEVLLGRLFLPMQFRIVLLIIHINARQSGDT